MAHHNPYSALPTDDPTPDDTPAPDLQLPILAENTDGAALKREQSQEVGEQTEDPTCRFVEAGWFQVVAALVIAANVVIMVVEANDADYKVKLALPDLLMLLFYIFELLSRILYFRGRFLRGTPSFVVWNVLDVAVVGAAALDRWVLPLLPLPVRSDPMVRSLLFMVRLLRIFRVLKIIRIFLQTDLSWTEEPKFQSFMGLVIAFNAILMGFETDIRWGGWFYIEHLLLVIYIFELSVRMKRFGMVFLSCWNQDIVWNVLDFAIVVSSAIDSWLVPLVKILMKNLMGQDHSQRKNGGSNMGQVMMLMRMMRLMRILRLVKLVKSVKPLYFLISGVLAALQGVMWVLLLTLTLLYAMGILATRLIGHGMLFSQGSVSQEVLFPFESVTCSMFTLFRIMSGASSDEEIQAMDALMDELPTLKFAYVFFMITSSWTLLSILTAVVSENMISTTANQEEEIRLSQAEEERHEAINKLKELFQIIDTDGSGSLSREEVHHFLLDRTNAATITKQYRISVLDVREVYDFLSMYGPVEMDQFVCSLVDVAQHVSEKSIMRIEARVLSKLRELLSSIDADVRLSQDGRKEERLQQQADLRQLVGEVSHHLAAQERRTLAAIMDLKDSVQALLLPLALAQPAVKADSAMTRVVKAAAILSEAQASSCLSSERRPPGMSKPVYCAKAHDLGLVEPGASHGLPMEDVARATGTGSTRTVLTSLTTSVQQLRSEAKEEHPAVGPRPSELGDDSSSVPRLPGAQAHAAFLDVAAPPEATAAAASAVCISEHVMLNGESATARSAITPVKDAAPVFKAASATLT